MLHAAGLLLAALLGPGQEPRTAPEIRAADLALHLATLASDEFEGRAPATAGGERTEAYLVAAFERAGLVPGYRGAWRQEVPLIAITPTGPPTASIAHGAGERELVFGRDLMIVSTRADGPVELRGSELVFVGYGIVAPEYDWNDYAATDVRGKTVLCLVNDPGFATQDRALFRGNAMTYYGRHSYKFEEAARQGAAACLVVHEEEAAGYPWQVVVRSWGGTRYEPPRDAGGGELAIQGWITDQTLVELVGETGEDPAAWKAAAHARGFHARALGSSASFALENRSVRSVAHNVVGRVVGRERPDETVLFCAHWDHLGRKPGSARDEIYNGAHDNASGTAGLIELAEAFGALDPPPARSITFAAFTAEESGLLGSRAFAVDPPLPARAFVGGVNMDGLNHYGPMSDLVVVGDGASELDELLAQAAAAQGRTLAGEPTPEKGYYYRSDHFNLAKVGVPMLYTSGGLTHRERGREYVARLEAEFLRKDYHQPSDEFDAAWDLSGAIEDLRLFYAVGRRLANGEEWPAWSEGSEFRAAREASFAERAGK